MPPDRKIKRRKRLLVALLVVFGLVALNRDLFKHPYLLMAKAGKFRMDLMMKGPIKVWWGDLVRTAEVKENAAYIGLGTQMGILDVSDPASPRLLSRFDLYGIVHGFVLSGDVLYCAHGTGGLSSFNVADPLHPIHLQRLVLPGYGMHVAMANERLLIFSNEMGGWDLLDVSDPGNMLPVRHFDGGWVSAARVVDGTAYVLDGWEGVVVYDMSDPEKPVRKGAVPIQLPREIYEPDPPPIWLEARDGYAYVSNGSDGMRVLDIRDPEKARVVGHLPLQSYSYTVAIRGNRAYMANLGLGLVTIDISTPTSPKVIGAMRTRGNAYDIILRGDRGYLSDGANGFMILDFSNPDQPREIGYYHVPARTRGVTLQGDRLIAADAGHGIRIFDVKNRRDPVLLGMLDTPGLANETAIVNDRVHVADVLGGYREVDISNPSWPRVIRNYAEEEHPWATVRDGDYLYSAMGHHGFSVFDLLQKPPAHVFSSYNKEHEGFGYTIEVAKKGNLALNGDFLLGMLVYDVKNPGKAVKVGRYHKNPWNPLNFFRQGEATSVPGIYADGDRAYVAGYNRGLEIIDLKNPANPRLEGRLGVPGHSYGVWKDGGQVCLSTYEGSLRLIDVKNPAKPRQRKSFDLKGQLWDVVCDGGIAYLAAGTEGLIVVDLSTGEEKQYVVKEH